MGHLTATVEEYEPETVTLRLVRGLCRQFASIISAAAESGFTNHAYFIDKPQGSPRFLADIIHSIHATAHPNHPVLRIQMIATRKLNAVTRCFLKRTGIRPTPYVVYATNVRTMETRQLTGDEATTYTIKGYR